MAIPAFVAALPRRLVIGGVLALLAAAPFSTVDEEDAKRFHGAVHAAGFLDPGPGRLYEHIASSGATQGGYPLCGYVETELGAPARAVRDRAYGEYYNRLGAFLPVEAALGLVFGDAPHARTAIDLPTVVQRLDTSGRPGPAPECEARAREAERRGNVVCVVDSVVTRDDQPWAIRFKHYAWQSDATAPARVCPLAEGRPLVWRVKGPLISAR